MSYEELCAAVRQVRQDEKITPEKVWHAASVLVHNGEEVLLWDWGGVYFHRCHVNLYSPVLNKIEPWIIGRLQDGSVPQLSVNAAFQEFHGECIAAGLVSEYAIHSCLRLRRHPKLTLFRAPYIGLRGATTYRIPNVEIAEELIRQDGGTVEFDALRQTMCGRMGLKEFQFDQVIGQLENVIRTDRGFLHADYFDSQSPGLAAIIEHVAQELRREGQMSVELFYNRKRVSCLQLHIDGPRMLHSVLSMFASESIASRPYPFLKLASADDATALGTIRGEVVAYIRNLNHPISCEELRQRFVKKRGFGLQTVMAAASAEGVVRYLSGIVVHLDTIGWEPAKQKQLVDVAERYYQGQVQAAELFARIDMLLELHESDLPPLRQGLCWTPTLIAELLDEEPRAGIFGNKKNALVFRGTSGRPATFGDFVALILERRFRGAANTVELSAFLRDSGVIAKTVTPAMLEGSYNLVIGEHEIAVEGAC